MISRRRLPAITRDSVLFALGVVLLVWQGIFKDGPADSAIVTAALGLVLAPAAFKVNTWNQQQAADRRDAERYRREQRDQRDQHPPSRRKSR